MSYITSTSGLTGNGFTEKCFARWNSFFLPLTVSVSVSVFIGVCFCCILALCLFAFKVNYTVKAFLLEALQGILTHCGQFACGKSNKFPTSSLSSHYFKHFFYTHERNSWNLSHLPLTHAVDVRGVSVHACERVSVNMHRRCECSFALCCDECWAALDSSHMVCKTRFILQRAMP